MKYYIPGSARGDVEDPWYVYRMDDMGTLKAHATVYNIEPLYINDGWIICNIQTLGGLVETTEEHAFEILL